MAALSNIFIMFLLSGLLSVTTWVAAQTATPYQGQQSRAIKSLSTDELSGYLQGKGMGLAKAAELNHYPGPRHVLDLAKPLGLTAQQIAQSQDIFNNMQSQAMALGTDLIEAERELDHLFASTTITDTLLENQLTKISTIHARLRFTHLRAHLKQKAILSEHQLHQYDLLRGYTDTKLQDHTHHH